MANSENSSKKFVDGEISYNESQELEDEEAFSYTTQLGFSIVLSMSLQSAIELGVFDILQKAGPGPLMALIQDNIFLQS
ncbi:PREDICTED: anthranilate N-methyltransferase-like [Lupinus angustifolius]|uniref:anthranilate N-methyltransferase-like n=1 Tax=Lupinus angustifolius TaxID=3871 RepID=UPI00092E5735|nr:PREDICTED: anthranilate N-methyltransferase-like [Lupinus angustifolius]